MNKKKAFTTVIQALNPKTGLLTNFQGPLIHANSFAEAQDYCNKNSLGYCRIEHLLEYEESWDGKIFNLSISKI